MLNKLREVLLTEYIGAILVALLIGQGVMEAGTAIARTVFWLFNHHHNNSVLGGTSDVLFPWNNRIFSAVLIALYFLTAYGIARWLYPAAFSTPRRSLEQDPSPEGTDPL